MSDALAGASSTSRPAPLDLPGIDFAHDAGARPVRLHRRARDARAALPRRTPGSCSRSPTRDLFIPVLTFVFGQAQLGGRVGVVSLARLRQEFYGLPAESRRFSASAPHKEALHETGHLFGLVHCADRACAMSLSTGVRQIDMQAAAFCGAVQAPAARRPEGSPSYEHPLANPGRRRRRSHVRIARRVAARGRIPRRHRRLRPRRGREGASCATTPSTSST